MRDYSIYTYIRFFVGRKFLQTCWFGIASIDNSANLYYTRRNVKVQAMFLSKPGTYNIWLCCNKL